MERDVDTVRVEVEYGPTVEGSDAVGPWRMTGVIDADKLTVPLKPLVPCTVTVYMADPPLLTDCDEGLTVSVKSGEGEILNDTTTECDKLPLVP